MILWKSRREFYWRLKMANKFLFRFRVNLKEKKRDKNLHFQIVSLRKSWKTKKMKKKRITLFRVF